VGTDREQGLNSVQVKQRFEGYSANKLTAKKGKFWWVKFLMIIGLFYPPKVEFEQMSLFTVEQIKLILQSFLAQVSVWQAYSILD